MRNGDPEPGRLVYAVVLSERAPSFGPIGLQGAEVHGVQEGDVVALVSAYPRVASIKLLRKNLAPYHRVLREAARRSATIPARFGQIARDEGHVHLALRRHYPRIRRELERFRGKVEMGLRVRWEVEDAARFLLERDPELRTRRDGMLAKTGGRISRDAAIRAGEFVRERLERAKEETTEWILARLPEGEARLDATADDREVTNAALLVDEGLRPELERAVEEVAASLGEDYAVRLEGPWPPFSFVDRLELEL